MKTKQSPSFQSGPPPRKGRNGAPKKIRAMPIADYCDVTDGSRMATWYKAAKTIGARVTIVPLTKHKFRVWRTA